MRILKAISSVLLVLTTITLIPSLAFAAENISASNHGGFFEGDFATVKAKTLDFLNSEIARLQSISTNVSAADNMTELQAALGRDKTRHGPRGVNCGFTGCGFDIDHRFGLSEIESVNDTTFTTIKANMVNSLQNMAEKLQYQENKTSANNNTERAAQLADKISLIQNFTTQINQTTDAAGLQAVTLTFMKSQLDETINKQISQLQNRENNTSDTNVTARINTRIADLKTLETNIDNTKSLSDLKTTLASSNILVSPIDHPAKKCGFKGHGRFCGMRN